MKRIKLSDKMETTDDMRPEYRFDYSKARPNRFVGRINKEQIIVVLDSDISKVFKTPEAVNTALRALITAMPKTTRRKKAA
jgi:hypothetical protein